MFDLKLNDIIVKIYCIKMSYNFGKHIYVVQELNIKHDVV